MSKDGCHTKDSQTEETPKVEEPKKENPSDNPPTDLEKESKLFNFLGIHCRKGVNICTNESD